VVHEPQASGSLEVSVHALAHATDPVGHVHVEVTQVAREGQLVAHPPQCTGSVVRSTHVVPHTVPPQAQTDAAHVPPVPHDFPQAPQFSGSVVRSTHFALAPVPQAVFPVGQVHTFAMQVAAPGQTVSQAPQFFGSVARSTQPLVHEVLPVAHAHTPETQATPLHDFPHAPQLFGSLRRLVHSLGHASGKLVGHTHAPPMHDAPEGHLVVQVPHAAGSLERSLQVVPQLTCGSGQPHLPATQAAGQALAHEPQLALSVLVSTHAAPHRVCPEGQGPRSTGTSGRVVSRRVVSVVLSAPSATSSEASPTV
jgi:hypothetical protein